MIYKIQKTNAYLAHEYDIEADGEVIYFGRLGAFSKYQRIKMECSKTESAIISRFQFSAPINYIPFLHWFGNPKQKKLFNCYCDKKLIGSFARSLDGYGKQRYIIKTASGETIYVYTVSKGKYTYACFYESDDRTQIAQADTFLTAQDGCFSHTLYLLDEKDGLSQLFLAFMLYYDNLEYTTRGKWYAGKSYNHAYSWGKYSDKYDGVWKYKHFGEGDFFLE